MLRLKNPEIIAHTQNSVERPQNRHLKPFKSRAELGGQLDPGINKGGRPKVIREETAAWLEEKDENGVTNARQIIESLGKAAKMSDKGHCVGAFKEIREMVEPTEIEGSTTLRNIDRELFREITERMMERKVKAIEMP